MNRETGRSDECRNYGRKTEKYTDDVQKCLRNEGKSIMIRGWMIQEEHGEEKGL